jgi:hypothetical protein
MDAVIEGEVIGRTLPTVIGRRAIIIRERAWRDARAVIVQVADFVGQPLAPVVVVTVARLRRARRRGQRSQDGRSGEKLQMGHLIPRTMSMEDILGQLRCPSRAEFCKKGQKIQWPMPISGPKRDA